MKFNRDFVHFFSLGGLGEIGANAYVYQYNNDNDINDYLIVDLGLGFGNQLVQYDTFVPEIDFLIQENGNIPGIVVTHGHEDHIGAIARLWHKLRCKVYATAFTAELIKIKFEEQNIKIDDYLIVVDYHKKYSIGSFTITWVPIDHSILESCLLVLETPLGVIIHSGDFKIDKDNHKIIKGLQGLGKYKAKYLFVDSTNVFVSEVSKNEASITGNIHDLVKNCDGAAWISCFSSNVERVKNIINIAEDLNKKVVLLGRSFKTYVQVAMTEGYLTSHNIIDEKDIKKYERNKLVYLVTGSQGEYRSVLHNLLVGNGFRHKIYEDDCVIFASRVIPGNENKVHRLYNILANLGIEYFSGELNDIHVSGHAGRKELEFLYDQIKPSYIIPIHGEHRHLREQSMFAHSLGYESLNVFNGQVINLFGDELNEIVGVIEVGRVIEEGGRLVDTKERFLKERYKISTEGTVFISICQGKKRNLDIRVHILGLLMPNEEEIFEGLINGEITSYFNEAPKDDLHEESIRVIVRRLFKERLGKKPIVLIHYH